MKNPDRSIWKHFTFIEIPIIPPRKPMGHPGNIKRSMWVAEVMRRALAAMREPSSRRRAR